MPSQRKRSNAFDDFPGDSAPATPPPASPAPAAPGAQRPAATSAARSPLGSAKAPQVERIERLKPSQMLPDRFQPRRLLPASLRPAFFGGQTDCYHAAGEWLAMAKADSGVAAEVDKLLSMGQSFDEHGQIKPITGSWAQSTDGRFVFVIETGERRFWAACLRAVREHLPEEPLLRVEVVEHPTRQRQVLENLHAETPSAVGHACEVAALILAELGIQPPATIDDEFDYFRQAQSRRMPDGLWDRVAPVMQLTRPRMVQLLNILHLPTPLLTLADQHRLPERVLREVLAVPQENWPRLIDAAIQQQLTSDEVATLRSTPLPPAPAPVGAERTAQAQQFPGRAAAGGLRRFANALIHLDEFSQAQALDEVADLLVVTGQAEGMLNLLGELARLVQVRLDAKRRG